MDNRPIPGWKVVLLVWVVGGGTCSALRDAIGDGPAFVTYAAIILASSTYPNSKRFAAHVNALLDRFSLIA